MTDRQASRTAEGVAYLRAAHQLLDAEPRILDDPVVMRLFDGDVEAHIRASHERFESDAARELRAHVVLRSRFTEDRLHEAVERGVRHSGIRQYVVLGAGLDTFALRQPAWAHELRIFEIDQPASQASKRERIERAGITVPENVTFVAVDFEAEPLADALRRGGVRLEEPVFFSWLGVTMYLTESAIDAVLRTVLQCAKGSEIVFTFAQPRRTSALADAAASMGEPWLTYFEPEELRRKLGEMGFAAAGFLTPEEAWERYFSGRVDRLPVPRRTSIAWARV